MSIFEDDLKYLTRDFGKPVVFGVYTTKGILALATEDMVNDDGFAIIRGETPALTYAFSDLPGLKRRSAITIAGVPYTVNRVDLEGDGAVAVAYLERA